MKFEIVVEPDAETGIEAAYLYLVSEASVEVAERWYNGLDAAIATLARMPDRCPLAPENDFFDEEIRQLLIATYRVLFMEQGKRVHILHVRHMAQRRLYEDEDL